MSHAAENASCQSGTSYADEERPHERCIPVTMMKMMMMMMMMMMDDETAAEHAADSMHQA